MRGGRRRRGRGGGGGGGVGGRQRVKGDSFLGVDEGDRAEGRGLIGGGDKLAF